MSFLRFKINCLFLLFFCFYLKFLQTKIIFLKFSHHFVSLDELILNIYILLEFDKIFFTIFNFTHTSFVDLLILWIYCNIYKKTFNINKSSVLLLDTILTLFNNTYGSMSITQLYIGSTHINDKKIIDRLSTHYQPFYGFSLIKVFFLTIMSLTHIIDKVSLLICKWNKLGIM